MFFSRRTRLPAEALSAAVFATGVAVAFFFLPVEEAEVALVGDILNIQLNDAVFSVALCALIILIVEKKF